MVVLKLSSVISTENPALSIALVKEINISLCRLGFFRIDNIRECKYSFCSISRSLDNSNSRADCNVVCRSLNSPAKLAISNILRSLCLIAVASRCSSRALAVTSVQKPDFILLLFFPSQTCCASIIKSCKNGV